MACEICKKPYIPPSDDISFNFDGKPHVCKICGQSFALKVQLKRHLLAHEGDVPYVCSSCENQSTSYNLRLSKQGNFVCETCNKCFNTKRSLLRHAGEHTMENILNCDECGESFKNMTALKKHIAIHKPKKSHSRNSRKNSSEASYQCQECGKIFARIKQYEAHCLNHKKYHCSECNVYFASNKLLQEHLSTSSCHSRSDTSLDSSNSNTLSNFNSETKKHECDICHKSFTRKTALAGHIVGHYMDDNHESPVEDQDDSDKDMDFQCNPKEEKSNELCLPKLTVRRSYSCEKCSLVFTSKIQLNKHMLSHKENPVPKIEMVTSEYKKTYMCRVCQQVFDIKENYKQHKLSHSPSELNKEDKYYTCQICLKVFGRKKHLKKHVKTHTDDNTDDSNFSKNPVEEGSADKSYSQDGVMMFVSKKEKRAKNFSCRFCRKLFAGETCLRKHEAKHDKDEEHYKEKEETAGKGRKGKNAKPLICEYCNEDFTGKRQIFMKHRLSHTPEVCGICDARFTDRASLREHCKIHIGTEEGQRFLECSQKVLDAKNGVVQQEPKVEYIYLVLR